MKKNAQVWWVALALMRTATSHGNGLAQAHVEKDRCVAGGAEPGEERLSARML